MEDGQEAAEELPRTTQEIIDDILGNPEKLLQFGEMLQKENLLEGFDDNAEAEDE